MMMSQFLKSVNFTKTNISRYLENKTLFFLQVKNSLIFIKSYLVAKNNFVAEVIFKIGFLVKSRDAGLFPKFQHGFWFMWLLVGLLLLKL